MKHRLFCMIVATMKLEKETSNVTLEKIQCNMGVNDMPDWGCSIINDPILLIVALGMSLIRQYQWYSNSDFM